MEHGKNYVMKVELGSNEICINGLELKIEHSHLYYKCCQRFMR